MNEFQEHSLDFARAEALFKVLDGGNTEEEAVYYTVLDPTTGQIMTLRLLAVA